MKLQKITNLLFAVPILAITGFVGCGQSNDSVDVVAEDNLRSDAHHAAEGIIDDETWQMIDDMIADTPHADMTLDDLGGGGMEATIDVQSVNALETLLADTNLLRMLETLDGDVTVTITFNEDGSVTMSILQMP